MIRNSSCRSQGLIILAIFAAFSSCEKYNHTTEETSDPGNSAVIEDTTIIAETASTDSCYITGALNAFSEPLIGATVLVEGTSLGAMTNSDGRFLVTTSAGAYRLVLGMVGMSNRYVLTEFIGPGDTLDLGDILLQYEFFHPCRVFSQDTSIVVDLITSLDADSLQGFAVYDGENRRQQMRHYIIDNGIIRFYPSRYRRSEALWSLSHLGERTIEQVVFNDGITSIEIDTDVVFDSLVYSSMEHTFQIAEATPDEWVAEGVTFDRRIYDTADFGQDSLVRYGFLGCRANMNQDGSWNAVVGYCLSIALLGSENTQDLVELDYPIREMLFSPSGSYIIGKQIMSSPSEERPCILFNSLASSVLEYYPFQSAVTEVPGTGSGYTIITYRPDRMDQLGNDGLLMSIVGDSIVTFTGIYETVRSFRISDVVPEGYATFSPKVRYDHVFRSSDCSRLILPLQYRETGSFPSELLLCMDSSGNRLWTIPGRSIRWSASANCECIACWSISGHFSIHEGASADTVWKTTFEQCPRKVAFSESGTLVTIAFSDRTTSRFEIRETRTGNLLYSEMDSDWVPCRITDEGFCLLSNEGRFMLISSAGEPIWLSPQRRQGIIDLKAFMSNGWIKLIYMDGRNLNVLSLAVQHEDAD